MISMGSRNAPTLWEARGEARAMNWAARLRDIPFPRLYDAARLQGRVPTITSVSSRRALH
jgi:hypothetical protein